MKLEASGIDVRRGERLILQGVDLTAAPGSLTALVGPNGAGKTTLLRVLAQLLKPSAGTVLCDGVPLADISTRERARRIAYLAQNGTAHWPLPVERLVALGRLPHRKPWGAINPDDAPAVERALRATDIADLRERRAGTLSGGEQVRVMLARALAVEAPILLVDEPVAALDPFHQLQVMEVLRDVAARGTAVVAVLHELTLAARFCDRLTMLKDGRVTAEGTPRAVLTADNIQRTYAVHPLLGNHQNERYVVPWRREDAAANPEL